MICSSIVAKLNLIYVTRIKKCIENNEPVDLENFQLEGDDGEPNDLFLPPRPDELWEKIDLFKVIETEEPLMSTRREKTNENAD